MLTSCCTTHVSCSSCHGSSDHRGFLGPCATCHTGTDKSPLDLKLSLLKIGSTYDSPSSHGRHHLGPGALPDVTNTSGV